jgi:hypothetical protein
LASHEAQRDSGSNQRLTEALDSPIVGINGLADPATGQPGQFKLFAALSPDQ